MPQQNKSTPLQNFEEKANPAMAASRLTALRAEMRKAGVDAFIVPRNDAHNGENVPPGEERLAYITGFTGSAGYAIITNDRAVIMSDGRYTLQVTQQSDPSLFEYVSMQSDSACAWLAGSLSAGARVGFDPWLHTSLAVRELRAALGHANIEMTETENLVDAIWSDRPPPPTTEVYSLPLAQTGKSAAEKISALAGLIKAKHIDELVLTLPESFCWLFNIRGNDIPNTPVTLGFATITPDGNARLFLHPEKITPKLERDLDRTICPLPVSGLLEHLRAGANHQRTIWIDGNTAPCKIHDAVTRAGAKIVSFPDPVLAMKARKNDAEITGMKSAQHTDAIAMAKFLKWIDDEAPGGDLTEIDIVQKLEQIRLRSPELMDISFDTISASGPNGAICHYRVTTKSNRSVVPGELILVDSGGQYRTGTTDITRTVACGPVTGEQQKHFTLVLKGLIALSIAHFPNGTSGARLDVLARQFLWKDGLNYNHGTGHGVGAFLGVHEGPCGISPRHDSPLEPGNVISNEPGYYREGSHGIRIENLLVVTQGTPAGFCAFETITFTPVDRRLIDRSLMTEDEIAWLNDYHQKCYDFVGAQLDESEKAWLFDATRPI